MLRLRAFLCFCRSPNCWWVEEKSITHLTFYHKRIRSSFCSKALRAKRESVCAVFQASFHAAWAASRSETLFRDFARLARMVKRLQRKVVGSPQNLLKKYKRKWWLVTSSKPQMCHNPVLKMKEVREWCLPKLAICFALDLLVSVRIQFAPYLHPCAVETDTFRRRFRFWEPRERPTLQNRECPLLVLVPFVFAESKPLWSRVPCSQRNFILSARQYECARKMSGFFFNFRPHSGFSAFVFFDSNAPFKCLRVCIFVWQARVLSSKDANSASWQTRALCHSLFVAE